MSERRPAVPLIHHELCFGCGRSNLFGLLLDARRTEPDAITGRCFIKQDHQGQRRGEAHDGILATALVEAMALACPDEVRLESLELQIQGSVPVGGFVTVQAELEDRTGERLLAHASARTESDYVCTARGSFRVCRSA